MTTNELVKTYLLEKQNSGLAAGTLRNYRFQLSAFATYCPKPIRAVSAGDVSAWLAAEKAAKGLTPTTIQSRSWGIKAFFAWCVAHGYIDASPLQPQADVPTKFIDPQLQAIITSYITIKRASGRSKSTMYEYKTYLTAFGVYVGRPLDQITNGDVAGWLVAEREARSLAPISVRARFRAIKVFFTWCVENDLLDKSPIKMRSPKVPKKTPRIAKLAHVQALLSQPVITWQDYRDRALIALLLDTGMRSGEVGSLLIAHVDLTEMMVNIPAGKDAEDRYAPMTAQCASFVAAYLKVRPPWKTAHLFLTERDKQVSGRMNNIDVIRVMQRRCAQLRIAPYINPHSMRHLFATKALNDGLRVEVISRIMGHARVDLTLDTYAKLATSTMKQEYNQHWKR